MSVFPNLIIIGAMKAGSTSLHDYLSLHPNIFMSAVKELDYFIEPNFSKYSNEWYKGNFNSDYTYNGESSQNYTKCHLKHLGNVPSKIKSTLGSEVKLIYILRDPIERIRSHYLEQVANHYASITDLNEYFVKVQDLLNAISP